MAREREQRAERSRQVVDAGRRLTEHESGGRTTLSVPEGLKFWLPKAAGAYTVEILPFTVSDRIKEYAKNCRFTNPGDLYFEQTFWMHRNIGPNEDSYVCPARTFNKPCPICEHRGRLAQDPKTPEELIKNLNPKERQLYLVYDYAAPQRGIQLWEVSYHNFGKLLDRKINGSSPRMQPVYRRFADPDEGRTLRLVANEENGKGYKFLEFSVDEFQEREEPLADALVNHGYILDQLPRLVAYDELKDLYLQVGGAEDRGAGGDQEPAAAARTGRGRARDPEPDPEPEPAPRGRGRAARDPEPDPEPPPARGRGRAADPEPDPEPAPRGRAARDPEPPADDWQVGDTVNWEERGKTVRGKVVKVDETREILEVQVAGRDRPAVIDFEEAQLDGPADDTPPPPKGRGRAAEPADDPPPTRGRGRAADPEPDPEPAPRGRGRAADPEPDPAPRGRARPPADDDGWDDAPPARGRGRAAEPEPEPPPAWGRGRGR